jgi:methyltransferase (TIGR00027 family)
MPRGASLTAEAVCFFRAVETARPPGQRLLDDPYAARFLPRSWRPWVTSPFVRLGMRGSLAIGPGALQGFVAVRHRFFDEALLDFLGRGGEQVVILGAGYDSRALRFARELDGRPLVEVDFPATQEKKRALIRDRVPEAKSAATYLPIDFEHHTLEEGLLEGCERHQFAAGKRSFFVWEGVAMYLQPETVDQTLGTVRRLSAPGSELVCDLWSRPEETTLEARMRRAGARMLGSIGEPIRFSLRADEAPEFFAARGWEVREVYDSTQLASRYDVGKRRLFPDNCVVRVALVDGGTDGSGMER